MAELKPPTLYSDSAAHGYLDQSIHNPHQLAIVKCLLDEIGIQPGDRVLEVGAGSGRYTRLLLHFGVQVVAMEPDEGLRGKLAESLGSDCEVVSDGVGATPIPDDVVAVVGFHVLHHLDASLIDALEQQIAEAELRPHWLGTAFLEPNPLNPLFFIQVLFAPGIQFREERRLWAVRFHRKGPGKLGVPCHVGLIPPAVSRKTGFGPARPFRVTGRWCPWSSYRIVARRGPGQ